MTHTTETGKAGWGRMVPIAAISLAAIVGSFTLGDVLSFEALRDNREALLAFRDMHYGLTIAVFMAIYVAIVVFSLPGALIAS